MSPVTAEPLQKCYFPPRYKYYPENLPPSALEVSVYLRLAAVRSAASPAAPSLLLSEFVMWTDAHPHSYSEEEVCEKRYTPALQFREERDGRSARGRERGGSHEGG